MVSDSRQTTPAHSARPHRQGDESAGPCAHAPHPPGSGVGLEGPAQHRGQAVRREQGKETVRYSSPLQLVF